jgi:hypothetical protein
MPHGINRLTHLEIDEISLVDHPANSETDGSGQKVNRAVLAIWKRDSNKEGKRTMGFKTILK